jgi:Mn2+/Fe2+ NRAMP family transporter
MKRLLAVLLASVIAAAFIGPGTVTTCARAGAEHRYALLWALLFSTVATLVLQEASGRLTVLTGLDLARALRRRSAGGAAAALMLVVVLGAIVVGCAAYQAGNVLGAVAGAELATGWPRPALTLAAGALAAALLVTGSPRRIALALSALVALMGVAFLVTAALLRPPAGEVAAGLLVPALPAGSGLLALGLVGTTVVPYNLFLMSGVARGQTLGELRFGLAVAIGLGGVISMGVLVVGAAVEGPFGYPAVAEVLAARLGPWAGALFAWGLCAAGLSSAVTAPLAAAITARGLFGGGSRGEGDDPRWGDRSWRYRAVWGGVLAVGVGFGLSGVRPVPAIVFAQAANGVLLPFAAIFLLLAVNDRRLMGERGLNGGVSNAAMAAVALVALVLGLSQLGRAAAGATGLPLPPEGWLLAAAAILGIALAVPVTRRALRGRRAASR